MSISFEEAAKIGCEEVLDFWTGRDSLPEAVEDAYERLNDADKKSESRRRES